MLCDGQIPYGIRTTVCGNCRLDSVRAFSNEKEGVMGKLIIGIDTGAKGAVACLREDGSAMWVEDMPSLKDRKGKAIVDGSGLCDER